MLLELNKIYNEDCLGNRDLETGMWRIPDKSVDMILCDLPYAVTRNQWDCLIPFDQLWSHYERIIKDRGAIVLTGSGLFSVDLINSNRKLFKYKVVWKKTVGSNQFNTKFAPLKLHEDILIFSKSAASHVKDKNKAMIYNPQIREGEPYKIKRKARESSSYDSQKEHEVENKGFRYPTDVIEFANPRIKNGHKTQKPVPLFEYLIKTYTNEGDTVLDNCMGSGTTAIACINTYRNYIGFELDKDYHRLSEERISKFNINN